MAICLLKTVGLILLALMLWPLAYSIWMSFSPGEFLEVPTAEWSLRWYRELFSNNLWVSAIYVSAKMAILSMGLSLFFGLTLAMYEKHYGLNKWYRATILIPFLIPPVVLAMGLLPWMHLIGIWGTGMSLGLAHSLLIIPISYLIISEGLASYPVELEHAARSLGASSFEVFLHVSLPLLVPWLLVSSLLAVVISLNEYIISLFLSTTDLETLPTVIWPNLRYTLTPVVAAASGFSLMVTIILLAITAVIVKSRRAKRGIWEAFL